MDKSVYTRPEKPKRLTVTSRQQKAPSVAISDMPEPLIVDNHTECHVTPLAIAHRMVNYLGRPGDYPTLEPSAGTGNLLDALIDAGYTPCELVAIERHTGLCTGIRKRLTGQPSITLMNECFLTYAKNAYGIVEFPRIIMNPPFKKVQQHMKAALNLLGNAGHREAVLVALVPTTYHHEEAETMETLPPDTFPLVTVSTKIVRFVR